MKSQFLASSMFLHPSFSCIHKNPQLFEVWHQAQVAQILTLFLSLFLTHRSDMQGVIATETWLGQFYVK